MSAPLSMADAAREVGLAYDTFRKRWKILAAEQGFPLPFRGRTWDAEAVAAWKLRRSHRPLPRGAARAPAAHDPFPRAGGEAQAAAVAQLQLLRSA